MSKRKVCSRCGYPEVRCLCNYISDCAHRTAITIIQCDKEGSNAKNTARLLPLLSKNIRIIAEQEINDVQGFEDLLNPYQHSALLFPSESALPITDLTHHGKTFDHIIVIDGTWRKAKKLFLTSPWLKRLPQITLSIDYVSQYAIRKTSVDNGLSTLEAIAYAVEEIEGKNNVDIAPFFKLLEGVNASFCEHMPSHVKSRYL